MTQPIEVIVVTSSAEYRCVLDTSWVRIPQDARRQGLSLDDADRADAEVLRGKDAIEEFLATKEKKHKRRPRTLQAYRTTLNNFRGCLGHRVRLTYDLTADHVWQFVECMANDGLKPKSINTHVMYVRMQCFARPPIPNPRNEDFYHRNF